MTSTCWIVLGVFGLITIVEVMLVLEVHRRKDK